MRKNSGNILLIILVAAGIVAALVGGYFWWQQQTLKNTPLTWEDCTKISGSKQLMIYPGQCIAPDGRKVTQPLSEEEKKKIQPPNVTSNWETYNIETEPLLELTDYQISLPQGWWRIEHSSNFQKTEIFQDTHSPENFTYKVTITEEKNMNEKTGQPFTSLQSLTEFPYEVPTLTVAGQQAIQVLPHAGSEMDNEVFFFSKDSKIIISIELDTPRDGSHAEEGGKLFDQILSTFKFL